MGRLIASVVLGLLLFGYALYHFELIGGLTPDGPKGNSKGSAKKVEVGEFLYPPVSLKLDEERPINKGRGVDPIQISGQLQTIDKQEVSSQIEGQLLFLGEEIPAGALLVAGVAPFLPDPCNMVRLKSQEAEIIKLSEFDRKVEFVEKERTLFYRRLMKGQMVQRDQLLALLNPIKALAEKRSKQSKLESAEAESRAAIATAREAKNQWDRASQLWKTKSIAEYDYRIAFLTFIRHSEEAVGKEEAVKSTKIELEQAQLLLSQHEIRNQLPMRTSVIKDIFRERGESVRPQDKIMELHSLDRLMAEGLLGVEYLTRLRVGMPISIEPTQEESPLRVLKAHRAEITSVAFTKDPANPLVVSASEDKSVLVWDRNQFGPIHYFPHEEPVRVVACSPTGAAHNLILAGCSDGSICVWDLNQPTAKPRRIPEQEKAHRDVVTSLAFSPNGEYFASGSADSSIKLWKIDGQLVYTLDAEHGSPSTHQGTITSLHFTPQCKLISASRDNTLRVWTLHEKGVAFDNFPIEGRSGGVSQLGVSTDGRLMLFDQGKTLQLLSVADGRTINTLQNPGGATLFETLAEFSPDASLVLTGGAPEGRLQLWSTPTVSRRGFEVRQLVTDERSPVTCAAFSSQIQGQSCLAVSGTKDGYVYLWPIPSQEDVRNQRIQDVPLTTINRAVDSNTRQVRIGIEVRNQFSTQYPNGRLIPGRPVTIVIE